MRQALLLLSLLLPLAAQTAVDASQVKTPPTTEWRVLAFNPAGQLVQLKLGNGLVIDAATGTLAATQTTSTYVLTPILEVKHQRLTPLSNGEYPSACGLSAIIMRNGLVMLLGEDYEIGASIRPKIPWPSTDIVSCFSVKVKPTA